MFSAIHDPLLGVIGAEIKQEDDKPGGYQGYDVSSQERCPILSKIPTDSQDRKGRDGKQEFVAHQERCEDENCQPITASSWPRFSKNDEESQQDRDYRKQMDLIHRFEIDRQYHPPGSHQPCDARWQQTPHQCQDQESDHEDGYESMQHSHNVRVIGKVQEAPIEGRVQWRPGHTDVEMTVPVPCRHEIMGGIASSQVTEQPSAPDDFQLKEQDRAVGEPAVLKRTARKLADLLK